MDKLTQDVLVSSSLRGHSEPDDVDTLKAGRHSVDKAAAVEALEKTLGQGIVTAKTECDHA